MDREDAGPGGRRLEKGLQVRQHDDVVRALDQAANVVARPSHLDDRRLLAGVEADTIEKIDEVPIDRPRQRDGRADALAKVARSRHDLRDTDIGRPDPGEVEQHRCARRQGIMEVATEIFDSRSGRCISIVVDAYGLNKHGIDAYLCFWYAKYRGSSVNKPVMTCF